MTTGIYGIFSTEDSSCLYVGQSKNIEARFKHHLRNLKGKHVSALPSFVEWFHDNNADKSVFYMRILEDCVDEDSVKNGLEIKWFNQLNPEFYGKVPSENETWVMTEETKEKIGNSLRVHYTEKGFYQKVICHCGSDFITTLKRPKKYCSESCYKKFDSIFSKPWVKTICENCKIETAVRHGKYCSIKCDSLARTIPITRERLYELYWEQNLSLEKIAALENVSRQTVFNKLKQFEIPRRGNNDRWKT